VTGTDTDGGRREESRLFVLFPLFSRKPDQERKCVCTTTTTVEGRVVYSSASASWSNCGREGDRGERKREEKEGKRKKESATCQEGMGRTREATRATGEHVRRGCRTLQVRKEAKKARKESKIVSFDCRKKESVKGKRRTESVGILAGGNNPQPLTHEVLFRGDGGEGTRREKSKFRGFLEMGVRKAGRSRRQRGNGRSRGEQERREERATHLLQELLGEVLEVALREGNGRGDRELASSLALELDVLAELAGLALDLDVVHQELLVSGSVELEERKENDGGKGGSEREDGWADGESTWEQGKQSVSVEKQWRKR
jgi:hypothetical protein